MSHRPFEHGSSGASSELLPIFEEVIAEGRAEGRAASAAGAAVCGETEGVAPTEDAAEELELEDVPAEDVDVGDAAEELELEGVPAEDEDVDVGDAAEEEGEMESEKVDETSARPSKAQRRSMRGSTR